MINDHVLAKFEPFTSQLLRPIYRDYSFANLPATLHFLLTNEVVGERLPPDCFGGSYPKPKKIVLLFVDSFGWHFWQRYAERSTMMRRVVDHGVLTPISALFPSTTAASVTTLNVGSLPARHGVYEWNLYVPTVGETIQSLPFSTLGENAASCADQGHHAEDMVLDRQTMHRRLAEHGVRSILLSNSSYAFSAYNAVISDGAEVLSHDTLSEALIQLRDVLASVPGKALINLYWGGLDKAAHVFGPNSPAHEAEVTTFWLNVDALLADLRSSDTMLLITADHGQIGARAEGTFYVNEICPELNDCLASSPTGQVILPNGSPRDMFLHVKSDRRAEVFDVLRRDLDGVAAVLTVDDAIGEGLFGDRSVDPLVRLRLGDILVLPKPGHFVWWRKEGVLENKLHGHHGGLVAEELITVAGVLPSL